MQLSGQGSNGEYLVHIAREPGALVSNSLKHFLHTTLVHTPFETASSRSFSAVSSAANRLNPTSPRCSSLGILLSITENMAMAPPLLEIACFNYESAVNAALGRADRIEWVFPCCHHLKSTRRGFPRTPRVAPQAETSNLFIFTNNSLNCVRTTAQAVSPLIPRC